MGSIDDYYNHLQEELLIKREALSNLFSHTTTKGLALEQLIRDFLKPRVRSNGVGHGQIVLPDGSMSTQLDVIVYDESIVSPVYSSGDLIVIPSEAVRIIVEVKSVFAIKSKWETEMKKVNKDYSHWLVRELPPILYFSFQSDKYQYEEHNQMLAELLKKGETVLDSFYVLKTRSGFSRGELKRFIERIAELS